MKQFHDAALTAGEAFGYSATQVADAEIELTKAGIGIKEQMGGALPGALALAAAGQMDVADATRSP
jgi:TP901 family phage tail tape measure protein